MTIRHNLCAFWALVSMAGGSMVAAEAPQLSIGSKAPAIQVDQWYKGKAITAFEPGHPYVVEFWATWCAPCRKAIPHLSELAAAYKGKATFVGVSIFEEGDKIPARIKKFVKTMGNQMAYNVAGDTADGRMAKTWVEAAGENSIPQTFLVDGQGRIAWIGHPMEVEAKLKQVLAGTFDLAKEAQARNTSKGEASKAERLEKGVFEALEAKDFDKTMAKLREALAAGHPNKVLLVSNVAPGLARLDAARAAAEFQAMADSKDHPEVGMAMGTLLDTDNLPRWIYEMGVKATQDQIAKKPTYGFFWHLLAAGQFRLGDTAKARESEEKALELLKADPDAAPEDREDFQKALDLYKK